MYFDSFYAFLQMGQHGPYVWSAYGISLVLILSNVVITLRQAHQVRQQIARRIHHETFSDQENG